MFLVISIYQQPGIVRLAIDESVKLYISSKPGFISTYLFLLTTRESYTDYGQIVPITQYYN
jgi:hypothetical protein